MNKMTNQRNKQSYDTNRKSLKQTTIQKNKDTTLGTIHYIGETINIKLKH